MISRKLTPQQAIVPSIDTNRVAVINNNSSITKPVNSNESTLIYNQKPPSRIAANSKTIINLTSNNSNNAAKPIEASKKQNEANAASPQMLTQLQQQQQKNPIVNKIKHFESNISELPVVNNPIVNSDEIQTKNSTKKIDNIINELMSNGLSSNAKVSTKVNESKKLLSNSSTQLGRSLKNTQLPFTENLNSKYLIAKRMNEDMNNMEKSSMAVKTLDGKDHALASLKQLNKLVNIISFCLYNSVINFY
jgi:hypothetical protein